MRHGGGADDVGGHKGALVDESQRKGGEREAGGFGDGGIALHRFGGFGFAVALEAFKQGETRAFGLLAVAVFAGKHAESERRVGQQRHIFAQRDFGHAHFIAAVEQVIRVLHRRDAGRAGAGFVGV